ncbi:hypothetical protein BDQ94DRAFT_163738 [Aspergillus welwitschiae]|uniref:Uncharacterized protein n=1 Tax=Aspergillus welwitschiae TaxID=1341132 RepID=A0A3F3PKJ8_9EURO|nr:hypothetical protein BDQ94DRAFT_163738 [Aspergillus welwitschiae]RDH27272.1 hypothetical protein BDQ94DRAFT_163738 [Aspergillus welwitschiae]
MSYHICTEDGNEFWADADLIEHLRKQHYANFIRRPGRLGIMDNHGHIWYCFECERSTSDHRSFNSDRAMLSHLKDCHRDLTASVCEH